jgi:cysteine-rich repeat protein
MCDDGNTIDGDGCSSFCTVENQYNCSGYPSLCLPKSPTSMEDEGNDTCAMANGPFEPPFIYSAEISTSIDVDCVAFTMNVNHADVRIDVRTGPANPCDLFLAAPISLIGKDKTTVLTSAEICPGIDPSKEAKAQNLASGIYYVRAKAPPFFHDPVHYELEISFPVLCGNGIREGTEECDEGAPTPTCDANCHQLAVCGDGVAEAPETCDDGNLQDGDCCASTCQIEMGAPCGPVDVEPNNDCSAPNGPFALPLAVDMPFVYEGAISHAGDVDQVAITVPAYADLRIETFAPDDNQCVDVDTVIEVRDSSCGAVIVADDDDGLVNCSLITPLLDAKANHVAPGTYVVKVRHYSNGTIPKYKLRVTATAICGNGIREGSEVCDGDPGCYADCTPPLVCGDGLLHPDEKCDDANTTSGDGCSASCTLESNYACNGAAPTVCTRIETNCGDGQDNDNDGQQDSNDPDCQVPVYFPFCLASQSRHVFKSPSTLGLTIPEYTTAGISHAITVPYIGTIARAAMLVNIAHTGTTDIDLKVIPPGALMPFDVCSDNGGFSDNFINTVFDSTCATSIINGLGPFKGCYQPETSFDSLIGISAEGVWTLNVVDDETTDSGTLDNWALLFCTTP